MPFLKTVTMQTEITDFHSLIWKSGQQETRQHSPTAHPALLALEKGMWASGIIGCPLHWLPNHIQALSSKATADLKSLNPHHLWPVLPSFLHAQFLTPRVSAALFADTAPKARFPPGLGSFHSSSNISLVWKRRHARMAADRHDLIKTVALLPFLSTQKPVVQSLSLFIPK